MKTEHNKREFRVFPVLTILASSNDEAEQTLRRAQSALNELGIVGALDEECYQQVGDDLDVSWQPDSREMQSP